MTISALQAAKKMGEHSGWSLSNLEMQKLLYLSHMIHLGTKDKPLVGGHFEAWDLGPVHPVLYHKAKVFGARPVRNIFRSVSDPQDGTECATLNRTMDGLLRLTGPQLVSITHWEDGAWARNYVPGERGIIIPDSHIRDEYRLRMRELEVKKSHSPESSS